MELRVKEICKKKGITLQELADMLDISRQALDLSIKGNFKSDRVQEIADALECSVFELIASDKYAEHSYNENGEWRGVLKKN